MNRSSTVTFASIVALSLLLLTVTPALAGDSFTAKVVNISDGDTIVVHKGGRAIVVQIAGIDAPEIGQAYAEEARQFLLDTARKQKVTIEVLETRANRSVVANVSVNGEDLALSMVESGLAWTTAESSEQLKAAQGQAKSSKEGLWASGDATPPWDYRESQSPSS